jgi:spore maturation protein CgeB
MRIAFFGSSLLSAYWNGAATYYRGILKALAARGHEVVFLEPDAFDRQRHRDIEPPDWAEVVVYPADARGLGRALARAGAADLVIKASGVGVYDAELEAGVLEAASAQALVAFWDVDAPATLERLRRDPGDPLRALLPDYDIVLTYGGGEPVRNAYHALGARLCAPIYNALDPDDHHPVPPAPRFRCDLAFLGNRLPDREARVEEFFLAAAARAPEKSFLLGGSGWEDKPVPANVRRLGHVFTRDHNALNCTARCVLNISRESMALNGWSPATRVFEAAGAGACLITDRWRGIEMFLEPGREVLVADDGAAVAEIVRELGEPEARRIGAAARRRVLAEHTYGNRALAVERALVMAAASRRARVRGRVA